MQTQASGTGRSRYIVRSSDPAQIAAFIESIRSDPGIALIDTIGPAGQPHTAVVAMSDERARALDLQFRTTNQALTIEPDRPLSLFGGSGLSV
jgi:hypothetical protein